MKVDFFIVGTQKGGTTAIHSALARADGVQMSHPKEIHFFDNEAIDWHQPDYDSLNACFDWGCGNTLRGEATPIYCYWPQSFQRIHTYNPDAKIIMFLRHPARRAYSQWRMEFGRGSETLDFADAISEIGRLRVARAPGGIHRIYSYVERGLYSYQIRRLQGLFPGEQLLFLKTEELRLFPGENLDKISRFLGVDCSEAASPPDCTNPFDDGLIPVPPQENLLDSLRRLTVLYGDDIRETARITGLSLSDWLDPDYQEPMARP